MPKQEQFPVAKDFVVEPIPTEGFGKWMRWRSDSLGVAVTCTWWDYLEEFGSRLDDAAWSAPWTEQDPFVDADQDWALGMWESGEHIYVEIGPGFDELARFRVPTELFRAQIEAFRRAARA